MGDMQFNGTQEEWDALVKKNRQITMAQQTAMQIMFDELMAHEYTIPISLIVKCKELIDIEKEQIAKAWDSGHHQYFSSKITNEDFENGEEYYKEQHGNL